MSTMRLLIVAFTAFMALTAAVVDARPTPPEAGNTLQFDLPVQGGRINLRDLLTEICEKLDVEPGETIRNLDWSIDVQSTLGRLQLEVFDRMARGVISTSVDDNRVRVTIDRHKLKTKLEAAGTSLERWLAEIVDSGREARPRNYGMKLIRQGTSNASVAIADLQAVPKRVVVLVHGLDDPGFMWRDLIPQLLESGYSVAKFEYPNDGPISDAADFFAIKLQELRSAGVKHVDVVAHSMGCLVTRDVLTRPAYYGGSGALTEKLPAVDRFIMLGPPNQGSRLARLQILGELREHLYRMWQGETNRLQLDLDGRGEAGVDLLPDSEFLRRLNDRPLPAHTQMTIIAGRWSPITPGDVTELIEKAGKLAESPGSPMWLRDMLNETKEGLPPALTETLVNGLGDGCVSIESTKLAGVEDHHIVRGNHLSMIVNVLGAEGTPPAIPIILERLGGAAGH